MEQFREKKRKNFRMWKSGKKWLVAGALVVALAGGTLGAVTAGLNSLVARAVSLPSGASQIGTLNGVPVVKSNTSDLSSSDFSQILGNLLGNRTAFQYIANNIGWQSNTNLVGAQPLSSYGQTATSVFGADGFSSSDGTVTLNKGGRAIIQNVGSVMKLDGTVIPVNMGVTYNSASLNGQDLGTVIMSAHNQGSTITMAWGSPTGGGVDGGGQTENGGTGGGNTDGSGLSFIDNVNFTTTLIDANTGQPIPDDQILMAMKVSDVDGSQQASVDAQGAIGYVLSPDTVLTQSGTGFVSAANQAINADTTRLSAASYVVVKQWNSNSIQFKDTDGAGNHLDIVAALFGNANITFGGWVDFDKTVLEYGKNGWNGNYNFSNISFQVIDSNGKVVSTIDLDSSGKAKSGLILPGTYTIHEISSDWSKTSQVPVPDFKVTVNAGQTTHTTPQDKAVVGQNKLVKTDKETGSSLDGLGIMNTAKYELFYGDDSSGSSAHSKDTPVKWSDTPNAKLLSGTKVTSAIIGGKQTDFGDAVVVDVDDSDLSASVGNLAAGKYYWKEVDAPVGYAIDGNTQAFTISESDPNTQNIVTSDTSSKDQIIKAAISIQKNAQTPGTGAASGINDIEFTATPINGTVANAVKFDTGISPTTGNDGAAQTSLIYGDWKIEETKGVEGYENIQPVYIHMTTDAATDEITISASYNSDFSKPFSTRHFNASDNSSAKNPNISGSVAGDVTSGNNVISLSQMTLTDKGITTPPSPNTPEQPNLPHTGEKIAVGVVALGTGLLLLAGGLYAYERWNKKRNEKEEEGK